MSRCLNDAVKPEEVERVKYLPQDHVEKVCNELAGIGEEGFERELKSVIFSHVPDAQRLGNATLDDLVRFQADEKQKRIDSLLKQLREVSRSRAIFEAQADPAAERELREKIKRREIELEAHVKTKPQDKGNPAAAAGVLPANAALLQQLNVVEERRRSLNTSISNATETLRVAERRYAVAKRLLEKVNNFTKDFEVFKASLTADAAELTLSADELVTISINRTSAERIRDDTQNEIGAVNERLGSDDPPGLRKQLAATETEIAELQAQLDAPNREYQAYLKTFSKWQDKRSTLEGNENDPESLKGLNALLAALGQLPERIEERRKKQTDLALQIRGEMRPSSSVSNTLRTCPTIHRLSCSRKRQIEAGISCGADERGFRQATFEHARSKQAR